MDAFCWGLLGTGPVSRKFLLGLRALDGRARVSVVASRSHANAERFAAELGVPLAAPDYAAAAASPEVDALYIATPPSEHEAHAMMGIAAGKPVLIEKPFALDAAAAGRIVKAAHEAGVFCMEGMWTRFLPLVKAVRARIEAGEIGEVRAFCGGFLGADRPDAARSLFDPARGGGALMHRGVYPLSLARFLLGPVEDQRAMARIGATGVDEDCAVTLRHVSGAISTIRASLTTTGANDMTIYGSTGVIHVESPVYRPFAARLTRFSVREDSRGGGRFEGLREGCLAQGARQRAGALVHILRGGGGGRFRAYYRGNGYHYEAEAFMQAVSEGATESDVMPLDESLDVMAAIDRARAAWGAGSRV